VLKFDNRQAAALGVANIAARIATNLTGRFRIAKTVKARCRKSLPGLPLEDCFLYSGRSDSNRRRPAWEAV